VNTTPLGQYPLIDQSPILPYEAMGKSHIAIDLIYNPAETAFLSLAKTQGATVCNGLGMLHIQAEESWKLWEE
jgi:shikimate dehydrogenase